MELGRRAGRTADQGRTDGTLSAHPGLLEGTPWGHRERPLPLPLSLALAPRPSERP